MTFDVKHTYHEKRKTDALNFALNLLDGRVLSKSAKEGFALPGQVGEGAVPGYSDWMNVR